MVSRIITYTFHNNFMYYSVISTVPLPSSLPNSDLNVNFSLVPAGHDKINITWTVSELLLVNFLVIYIFFCRLTTFAAEALEKPQNKGLKTKYNNMLIGCLMFHCCPKQNKGQALQDEVCCLLFIFAAQMPYYHRCSWQCCL